MCWHKIRSQRPLILVVRIDELIDNAAHVDEIRTFSLVNPSTPAIDESSYARWNAGLLGARHVEVPFDSSNW